MKMSGSDVEHVSGFVDGGPPQFRRLSSSSTNEYFFDALSNGSHEASLNIPSSPPISAPSGTTYTTQPGLPNPQSPSLPTSFPSGNYPNDYDRSSPDPDEFYRQHPPVSVAEDNIDIGLDCDSPVGPSNIAGEQRPVHRFHRVSTVPPSLLESSTVNLGQYRSVSDTFRTRGPQITQGPSTRSRQASFKDLVNKFNNNVDQVLSIPSSSTSISREQSRATSPVDHPIRSRAVPRRRDTHDPETQRYELTQWNSTRGFIQDSPLDLAPPIEFNNNSLTRLNPSSIVPRRRLFGELLTVDTGFHDSGYGIPSYLRRRGSEGSITSPTPAFLDRLDPSSNLTPLTPTAWYLGRTPFLEAVSTGENVNNHRRTRSDIPGNSPVGASTHPPDFHMAVSNPLHLGSRTYLESPHSKSRIPISSRRLNSPTGSDVSSPSSPKADSPFGILSTAQTPLPPKGMSRLPKPSPKSPREVASHDQPTYPNKTSLKSPASTTRVRRDMSYGRPRHTLPDKSPLLEAYIAAPPPKKSPPLRSSRPRQPISHTTPPTSRSKVVETVSNFQRQINRDREPRSSKPRERRLPELGNVDFATRRQRIQQAFNRTVQENERREEKAAELRRQAQVQAAKRDKPRQPEPEAEAEPEREPVPMAEEEQIKNNTTEETPSPSVDDTATIIDESHATCDVETQVTHGREDARVPPQLHLDTKVPLATPGTTLEINITTMDSPTLGRPVMSQENKIDSTHSDFPPASARTSSSADTPVTAFDPEPQPEISGQNLHTSHRTLLSEIMRIRESSSSSSSCDEHDYGFSDNDDKESIPIKFGFDELMHSREDQSTRDLYIQNQTSGDLSNRWSMSSWSSSLRNQQSTDGQCEGSGDDLSQLHRSVEDSEIATQSCSASSCTPSIPDKHVNSLPHNDSPMPGSVQRSGTQRSAYGQSRPPSLAKLGGWDSKRVTQLYFEHLARGGGHGLPMSEVQAPQEPRISNADARLDGRTDSLTEDPVLVSRLEGMPSSDRLAHSASLVLRDDWEHASPSIMDWMQVAADDGSATQEPSCDASSRNDGVPTPKLISSETQGSNQEEKGENLGLAINIQSPGESDSLLSCPPPLPRHDPPPPPAERKAERESIHEAPATNSGVQAVQPPINPSISATFAPLDLVQSTGSSEDSLRRIEPTPSPQALGSSATSLVPSSLEQPRPEITSPTPEQRRLKKRRHVIKELVDTEYTFGRDMKVVDDIYKGTSSSCLDLSAEDVKVLFANSDQVVQFSMTFQDSLKEAAKSVYVMPKSQRWSSKRRARSQNAPKPDQEPSDTAGPSESEKDKETFIGQAFLTHMSYMEKVYTDYLKNHDSANKKLQTLQRSAKVAIWLKECREWASDLTSAWDLDSLLVKPVQRILKYPLLLAELLDSTPSDHPDHTSLVRALEEVTNISVRINEMKKRADLVGQVVGRKRKESDVRAGLSKAFGRRTEKLRQQVGLSDMFADKEYDALSQRFGDNFFQLQVVMRDAEMYTREVQGSMDCFHEFVTAIEAFIDISPSNYHELEGKWRALKVSSQDIMAVTLPEHLDIVRKSVIDPMVTLLKLHDGPQRVMKKRDKRLMDYARFKTIKDRGDKPDKKTAEQGEQFIALNETLKDELPKLYTLTAKLMEACLKNFVQIQTTWYSQLQKKIGPLIDSFPDDIQKIIDEWSTRFNFSESQVLTLGICNGSLLSETSLVNFNTPSTGAGINSPRRPSTVHSTSTRVGSTMEESPKASHDFSSGNQPFQSPNFDGQSQISLGRHRADSSFSGRPAPDTPELPRSQMLQQVTSTSSAAIVPSNSNTESFPRLPRLSLDSPFLEDVIRPSQDGNRVEEDNPISPGGRYSNFFSSAMPMSDTPRESAPTESNLAQEPAVLFLAASIYEFNIDRARREAGYPYLTYVAGEIFDVIAEKGELWLAKNQDDPTHQVGWIWNKHFAKLST